MKTMFVKSFALMVIAAMSLQQAVAQTPQKEEPSAAANATNPLAFVTNLQVQPNFTWKDKEARLMYVTSRLIQPTASVGLPFIKSKDPSKVYTIYRLEVPLIQKNKLLSINALVHHKLVSKC